MVQLLGVRANFTIQGINLYDSSKGQSFYERSCGAEGEDEVGIAGMADLDLHGPSKTISGEDLIGAEIFYPVSQQSKRSIGSEKAVGTELDAMQGSKLPAIACYSIWETKKLGYPSLSSKWLNPLIAGYIPL